VLDAESFATLLTQCYQRCWLIAAAITGDRAEADDIVQEASMIALRKLDDFRVGTNFTAWISHIVRLTALNHIKKFHRRGAVVTDPSAIDKIAPSAVAATDKPESVTQDGRLAADQTDFHDQVLWALHEVSDVARACLLLRVVQQLTYADIAETLQIPEGTAMSHVHRAKQSIRQHLMHSRPQPSSYSTNPIQR
jgi:RNA polymerase sigma-70 factor, ECF subfamily